MTVPSRANFVYDVAIVGAGPAGLSTAVYARLRGPVGRGARRARLRRPGGRERPHRELLRLSDRNHRPGADRSRLHPGAEVRRRRHDPDRRQDARLRARRRRLRRSRRRAATAFGRGRSSSPAARAIAARRSPTSPASRAAGVWYWASPIEARPVRRRGGRSGRRRQFGRAGARSSCPAHAAKVRMMVRGPGLARQHVALSDRPDRGGAEHRTHDGNGDRRARRPAGRRPRDGCGGATAAPGEETEAPIRHVFLFIGADPATEWLQGCGVAVDKAGFVDDRRQVGERGAAAVAARIVACPASSRSATCGPGRSSGSAAAIGEGAQVVAAIHAFLAACSRRRISEPAERAVMPKTCTHLDTIREVTPERARLRGMPEDRRQAWVHLRICRTCGHVGCCDQSPDRHATKHFHATAPSDHRGLRSAGRLGLVLCRRGRCSTSRTA